MPRKQVSTSNDADSFVEPQTTESVIMDETITNIPGVETAPNIQPPTPSTHSSEQMVKMSDVEALIQKALREQGEESVAKSLIRKKRVEQHLKTVHRFDGKWVVGFVDRNKDEYSKQTVHSFDKLNPVTNKIEWHVELKFDDGSTKEVPGLTYIKYRTPVLCAIEKREKIDKTFSTGVTNKKVITNEGFGKKATGQQVSLEVEVFQEIFHMKLPDGRVLQIPDYALA